MNVAAAALTILLCMVHLSLFSQETYEDEGFELVREKNDVRIYERWIFFPKKDPPVDAREVMGVFRARTTIEEAVALVRDEARIKQWQSHVSKFKVYPQNDTVWFEYSYHDIPWPVSDQDHFLIYSVEENIPGERFFFTFESIVNDKLAPVHDDATRMELSGSWLFEKKGNEVKVSYRILSMPSNIPRIFTDPVIRNNMMSTITSYIELLEED